MLALAALIIGWPWLAGQVTIPWDAKAHFLPQIQFLAHSFARGQSPFWAPYVFSGQPQIADPQSMIFSPPFLLLALLNPAPSVWAADATLLAMVFLGGAALMLWFRDQGWHWAGALIAALAFAYGAAMAWRIQHVGQVLSLTYLPITMLCLDRALRRRSIVYGAAAGVAAALIVLGRDQVALLSLYLLAGFAAWRILAADRPVEAARANLLPLAAGAASALLVFAVPVLLTVLFAAESNRPEIDYIGAGRGSLHPALLLTLVAPDVFGAAGRMEDYWGPPSFAWSDTGLYIAQNVGQLYIGAIPLLLILLAGLRGQLWTRDIRFFTVASVLMVLYALGWYTPAFQVFFTLLPGISLYRRPADAVFLIGALGAILAGYAVHRLFTDRQGPMPPRQALTMAGSIGGAFLLAIALAVWRDRLPLLPYPLGMSALTFLAAGLLLYWVRLGTALQPTLAAILLAAFTTLDLAYHNGPTLASALPPSTYAALEPNTNNATIAILKSKVVDDAKRRDRIELTGLGFHWPNASLTHSLENTLGYNPLRLRLYSAATGAEDHVGLPDQRKFSPLLPSYRSKLASLLGLRFIAAGAPIDTIDRNLKPGDLPLVARTSDGFIYENRDTYDRVLFATSAQSADFERMLKDGQWPDVDLRTTVLLEDAGPARTTPAQPGEARIVSYTNTNIELAADSPDGGWVVLNDVWQPWWFAEVDGRPAEILRANVLFRAVAVPPGRHKVRFVFRPLAGALHQLRSPVPRHAP
ncbi:MAG TPA: hypothetical protein VFR73_04805 [Hyphomicrobiaceae bacterium]|nr:hypothetical protein [Hyphomicrobiaceae bacterium]